MAKTSFAKKILFQNFVAKTKSKKDSFPKANYSMMSVYMNSKKILLTPVLNSPIYAAADQVMNWKQRSTCNINGQSNSLTNSYLKTNTVKPVISEPFSSFFFDVENEKIELFLIS